MSGISTHILDTAKGLPARGVPVALERQSGAEGIWAPAGKGITDTNGRVPQLLPSGCVLLEGVYRLTFRVNEYYHELDSFYSEIVVVIQVRDPSTHHHVPLLLSPYGYTTYRGS